MMNLTFKHVDQKSKSKLQKKNHRKRKHPTYRFKYLSNVQCSKFKILQCSAEIINTNYSDKHIIS